MIADDEAAYREMLLNQKIIILKIKYLKIIKQDFFPDYFFFATISRS